MEKRTLEKSIILGNGINGRLGISQLSYERVYRRFINNLKRYSLVFLYLYSLDYSEDDVKKMFISQKNIGIEVLAGVFYRYVKNNVKKRRWTYNDEYRLQDLISGICLLSIFYDESGKSIPDKDRTDLLPCLDRFKKIYTLNYHEFWNTEKERIFLHGELDYSNLANGKNIFFYSPARYCYEEYRKGIDEMQRDGIAIPIDSLKYVFAPEGIKKDKLICIAGLFPHDDWHPDDDLFPFDGKNLYKELDDEKEICIFGVSPYGDESLIDKINEMNHAVIFIYGLTLKSQYALNELNEWNSRIIIPHVFMDANDL